MNGITFYKATAKNVPVLVEYRIRFALELAAGHPGPVDKLRAQMTPYFTKATADGSCISVIARCEGEVAGIGSVHFREMPGNFKNPSGRWGYVMNMYTVPQHRRKGVCSGVLNKLIDEGQKLGVTAFELHATQAGEPVYLNNGFGIHHEPTLRKFLTG